MKAVHLPVVGEPIGRRTFLELALATAAAAGVSGTVGCNRVNGEILPFSRRVDEIVPGNPLSYATAFVRDGLATGVVIAAREGRPIKVEGNPDHPSSLGATGSFEQAALLSLYDPARASMVKHRGEPSAFLSFLQWTAARTSALEARRGAGLAFLLEPTGSPLQASLKARILEKLPRARFYAYSPTVPELAYQGAALAFGEPYETDYDFENARVVLALDADFLGTMSGSVRHARAFAATRAPEPGAWMSRLYAAEAAPSLTGMMADHRLRVRSSEVAEVAFALLSQLLSPTARAPWSDPVEGPTFAAFPSPNQAMALRAALAEGRPTSHGQWVDAVSADLRRHRGEGIVAVGPRQPPAVHAVGHAMNALLGNLGKTVHLRRPALDDVNSGPSGLEPLLLDIDAGNVDTLVIDAFDPVYSAPADAAFGERLARVEATIYRSMYEDATARHATWFIPATHEAESWGDARAFDGTVSLIQPLILPLFHGITLQEVLVGFLGEGGKDAYAILRSLWEKRAPGPDFDAFWTDALKSGVVKGTRNDTVAAPDVRWSSVMAGARGGPTAPTAPPDVGLELNLVPDLAVHDGRFADNGWLQELPNPVTKIAWDNPALIGPTTAKKLAIESGDVVRITFQGRTVVAPALVLPGVADGAVSLTLGYGRTDASPTARNVGVDAYRLRTAEAPWFGDGATLEKTGEQRPFASTQPHWTQDDRPLALSLTYRALLTGSRELEDQQGPLPSLYEPFSFNGYKWGMAIDLAKCTGCSACVVACAAENNGPIVGKDQVEKGRDMHWLRIDRYFAGEGDHLEAIYQPVMCVQCENAPCEYVCPVNATVHSSEGLNQMVYNRCVGTRYCSNNCPYKVRRFNYLAYQNDKTPTEKMLMNPEVTVRSRGVMEKCTYCVQRIERVRIDRENAGLSIKEGDIVTACQQACPSEAIVFGNLNDPASRVARLQESARSYPLLHDLGTRPRTLHLARVKNPNPELA